MKTMKLKKSINRYIFDLETTADEEDKTRVWAVGGYKLYEDETDRNFYFFSSISRLIKFFESITGSIIYFHNLQFDGEFILNEILAHGWKWVKTSKDFERHTFTTLISDMNEWYMIELCFFVKDGRKFTVKIQDSLKIIPFKVKNITEVFGFKMGKGEIDYTKNREIGHKLTKKELDYLKRDCIIVKRALEIALDMGLSKLTIGAFSLSEYSDMLGKFNVFFPALNATEDKFCRQAYRGGYTYVNEKFKNKVLGPGIILDNNSLYPYILKTFKMPIGKPVWFEGKYADDRIYDLYIQSFRCNFKLKDNMLPTVQLKNSVYFKNTEYVKESLEDVQMTMCSTDFEIFKKHYNIENIEYLGGYKFRSSYHLFDEFLEKWAGIKEEVTRTGEKGKRKIAKLVMNSLTGKFATRIEGYSRVPYFGDGKLKFKLSEKEDRKGVYVPVSVFITAGGRQVTISAAQALYDRFIYSDTDSIHLIGQNIPDNLKIDQAETGAWKIDEKFTRAKYLRAKCYIHDLKEKSEKLSRIPPYETDLRITCAGLPENSYKYVTFDNFEYGAVYFGKLRPVHVQGGIILKPTTFTIKVDKQSE